MVAIELLTFEEIKAMYPNEWVLLGDPEIEGTEVLGGIVLLHGKDKREIAYAGRELVKKYQRYALRYTGTFPQKRRVWL